MQPAVPRKVNDRALRVTRLIAREVNVLYLNVLGNFYIEKLPLGP